jgi:3'(2'), 5'-bisphosphate nucleotidase
MSKESATAPRFASSFSRENGRGVGYAPEWRSVFEQVGGRAFLEQVCEEAAAVILEIYHKGSVGNRTKDNGSPLTEADLASAAVIERALLSAGRVPVVCEESLVVDMTAPDLFWLVDPLDGTKEFLDRNGEFTVNIALIAGGEPVVGAIGIPARGEVFTGVQGEGALRRNREGKERVVENLRLDRDLIASVSRSHAAPSLVKYLNRCQVSRTVTAGSALKFCSVASGESDLYPRLGRTMEWDTAAGHCILREAGGEVVVASNLVPLTYGKPGFANPSFLAARRGVPLLSTPE